MKKLLAFLLVLGLLSGCFCGCNNTPSETTDSSPTTTDVPTTDPTETTSPNEPDVILFDFEDSGVNVFTQPDMSYWGITDAVLSVAEENTDSGKGMKVTLNRDSTRFCQSLITAPPATFVENVGKRQYLRLWIYNQGDSELNVAVIFTGGQNTGALDASGAIVTRCDGQVLKTVTTDASGAGEAGHVQLAPGFSGWIAFPLNLPLLNIVHYPLISDLTTATEFKLDIRPNGVTSSEYYVIDEICMTNNEKGATQVYNEYVSSALIEIKTAVANGLASYLNVVPKVEYLPEYDPKSNKTGTNEWENIYALTFDGATLNGGKTKVFAYIGYPEGITENAPAVVLVHGGMGHPYAQWIKEWTDRGYVAIAFENTGYFPTDTGKGIAGRDSDPASYWAYGLNGVFAEDGYVNAPTNSGMMDSGSQADTQWMYHCVAQTILAHNILRTDPVVDPDRIGITGISWGGVISSIAIGYDNRFAFAIPVYCTGYLQNSLTDMATRFGSLASTTVWSAQDRFDQVDFPVLWLCWNDDSSCSVISPSLSYLDTMNNNSKTTLSIIHNMQHYHSAAWNQAINYRFADWAVNNGAGLTKLDSEPAGRSFTVTFTAPIDANSVSAKLYFITEALSYSKKIGETQPTMDQTWLTVDCSVSGNSISCDVPADAYSYYLEITTTTPAGSYVTTSALITPEHD